MAEAPDWIAVEYGPAGATAWAMRGGQPVAERQGRDPAAEWPGLPVVASGHPEVPLMPLPAKPLELKPVCIGGVFALPGLSQSDPRDAMRGPETLIAGFLSLNPGWDGVICLTGPVTRWALVSAEEVVSVQPFLARGLRDALLATDSLAGLTEGGEGFDKAVGDLLSRPERLAARLAALAYGGNQAELSGLLIGAELAAARPYWLGQPVAVIGEDDALYTRALGAQGVPVTQTDTRRITLAGLNAGRRRIDGGKT